MKKLGQGSNGWSKWTRLVQVLFLHSSGRLVVGLRTGSRSDIGLRDTSFHGRFDRRPGNLGSAWSQGRFSK